MKNSPLAAKTSLSKLKTSSGQTTPPNNSSFEAPQLAHHPENSQITKEQKQSIINQLIGWLKTLDQQSESKQISEKARQTVQIGIENQKQHLLLLGERIEHVHSKSGVIHALQETSESLGKEAALVRFNISHLGFFTDLTHYDTITTEMRYHILMCILNLSGGTYVISPQKEAYFGKTPPIKKTRTFSN